MKNKKKYIIGVTTLFILVIIFVTYQNHKKPTILKLGIISESNWNVANASAYRIFDETIKEFESTHPGIKIEYESGIRKKSYSEWLARKVLSGETPDVFMILTDEFYKYASLGILQGLDNKIEGDSKFRENLFYKTALDTGIYKEEQYAIPFEIMPKLMFVNKTLLASEGIDVPNTNWTWDTLENIITEVTKDTNNDGTLDQFGITNYSWQDAVYSNGGQLFDTDGTKAYFSNENVINSVKFVQKINQQSRGIEVYSEDFNAGRVAFMPLTFSEYRTYKTYPYRIKRYTNFQWDCITMPAGPEGKNTSEIDTLLMGISKNTKYYDLAWEFLRLLTTDSKVQRDNLNYSQSASVLEYVTGSRYTESIIRANMDVNERVIDSQLLNQVIKEGVASPKFESYDEIMALANSRIDQIYKEEKNVDSSMKLLQQEVTSYLRR